MSSANPPGDIPGDPHFQTYPPASSNPNHIDRQLSMSVDYLTRNREHPPYDNLFYPQPLQQNNMPHQQQQARESYDRPPPAGPSHPAGPPQATSSTTSSHSATQQTPRITLPPLSAITDNQEAQQDGTSGQ